MTHPYREELAGMIWVHSRSALIPTEPVGKVAANHRRAG